LGPKFQAQKINLIYNTIKEKCEQLITETMNEINDTELRKEVQRKIPSFGITILRCLLKFHILILFTNRANSTNARPYARFK